MGCGDFSVRADSRGPRSTLWQGEFPRLEWSQHAQQWISGLTDPSQRRAHGQQPHMQVRRTLVRSVRAEMEPRWDTARKWWERQPADYLGCQSEYAGKSVKSNYFPLKRQFLRECSSLRSKSNLSGSYSCSEGVSLVSMAAKSPSFRRGKP